VGCILGALIIDSGATVQLNTADALGWGGGTAVTQINVNGGTLTNNVAGNNSYLASWALTNGTMSSLGGGTYHIIGGSGTITTGPSANPSAINANVAIRGASTTLSINVADGAAATDLVMSGVIANSPFEAGNNGITKAGAGTLVLSGANTYTGNTTVSAGTLLVNGSLATGAVNVGAGCYLGGAGTIGGNTTVSNGAVLIPGTIGTYGTLAFGASLTLAPGATVNFDLGTNYSGANDQIAVSSALTLNGNAFHIKAPGSLVNLDTNSDYVLITADSISGSFASIPVWDVAPANSNNFSVVTSGTTITLHYSTLTSPTGSGFASPSTAWHNQNVLISVTVTNGSGTVDPNTGVVLNAGTLDVSLSSVPLVLSGTPNVYTKTITIPASASFGSYILTATITDSYSDVGTANIALNVSSTETWNGGGSDQNWDTAPNWVSGFAPDLTGDDLVFAGTVGLVPNMDNNYSVDSLTFSGNAGSFTIGSTTSSTLTLTGGGITNNSAYAQTLNVPVADAGGGLTKSGNGTVILAAINTYTGNTTINAGVLNVSGAGQLNAGAYAAAIVDNGTFAYSSSASQVLLGAISGTGGMTVNATNGGVLTLGSGAGSLMTYTGPTIVDGGELQLYFANVGNSYGIAASSGLIINNGASVVLMNDNSLAGGNFVVGSVPVTINAGGVLTGSDTVDGGAGSSAHIFGLLTLNGGTLANGGTGAQPQWGTWNLDGGVVVNGGTNTSTMSALDMIPTQAGGTIFSVTNGGTASGVDLNVTGTLINGTSMPDTGIILDGNGTMVLSGANTYAGQTIVSNGTLLVNGSITGAVTVEGGTLGGIGTVNGNATNSGTVAPGTAGSIGTLSFNNNLTLQAGGVTSVKLNESLAPAATNDQVDSYGTLAYGGTLAVSNLGGSLHVGDTFQLFLDGGYTGNFASVTGSAGAGLAYSFNPTNGVLSVVAAAAPPVSHLAFTSRPMISGTSLTFSVTNTGAGLVYLLTGTNIANPIKLNTWVPIWTNVLSGSGSFTTNLSNAVIPGAKQQFFILSTTNN
jgi:autotransporter-associated beta strand protein